MAKRGFEFTDIQVKNPEGATFDLTHDVKLSFQSGRLIPTLLLDCLPGDKFHIAQENMMRFMPLIAPVMHRVYVNTHYFFVPNRLLWPKFDKWMSGDDSSEPPFMSRLASTDVVVGSLLDYMGVPICSGAVLEEQEPTAFPLAAYKFIWNEYYRDQNLTNEIDYELEDGANETAFGQDPLFRSWMHDYFTSALPWAQKGAAVQIPVSGEGNPLVTNVLNAGLSKQGNPKYERVGSGSNPLGTDAVFDTSTGHLEDSIAAQQLWFVPNGSLEVDIQANAGTIADLRRAIALQEWLEKNARGGTRYSEFIYSHWKVRTSDSRLGRPEYLGGITQNVVISEVLSTAETLDGEGDTVNPVGQMAGHGITVGGTSAVNYFCEEHGWIMGITSVLPRTAYQQGLARKWTRPTRLDYAFPTFALIGEQPIYNREIYIDSAQAEGVFGYIPRYSEYKFESDRVAGEFRDSLDFWHMGRIFNTEPALDSEFTSVTGIPPRVFATEETQHILAHIINKVKAYRKLPKFSTPMI